MAMTKEERREYNRQHYLRNREKAKARAAKWRADNPDRLKEQTQKRTERYRGDPEFREYIAVKGRESRERCKPRIQAYEKMRGHRDREKLAAYTKQWREDNADHLRDTKREWELQDKKKHPAKYTAKAAETRAKRLKRYVDWADKTAIAFFYECRPDGCHVDHVIPLQGGQISGLHVAENLQWLPAYENRSKSNKF